MRKKGFTLVELSIVLVIIGLLIGGILVGQSLIDSARANSFVSQMQQVDVALKQFKAKFKYFPGDSPFHSVAGDGDGEIENSTTNSGDNSDSTDRYDYEISNFWPHLQQDGFLRNKYSTFSNNASAGIKGGVHAPTVDYKSSVGKAVIAPWHYDAASISYEFSYLVCGILPMAANGATGYGQRYSAFTPAEAFSIDAKIDDGLTGRVLGISSYTGKIFGTNWMNDSGQGVAGDCWTTTNIDQYNANYTPKSCCLQIQMNLK